MQKRKVKGITEVVISALLYGFTPCICSITYALGNNQTSMTFFRNLLALPVFLLLLLFGKSGSGNRQNHNAENIYTG